MPQMSLFEKSLKEMTIEEKDEAAIKRGLIKSKLVLLAKRNTRKQVEKDWALIDAVRELRDTHGYTQLEISTMMKIPRHWVRSIIFRFCIDS